MKKLRSDVIIYGATPAGIAAALRIAREKIKVILIHYHGHIGGMPASGLSTSDTLYLGSRSPVNSEFIDGIRNYYLLKYGNDSEPYQTFLETLSYEAHVAEQVFNDLVLSEPYITLLKHRVPIASERRGRMILALNCSDMDGNNTVRLDGKVFMDCSYEGDLAAVCGVPYRIGRESRSDFNEAHAGRIFCQYESGNYPKEAVEGRLNLRPFDLTTGRIFPGSTGDGDRSIQAYNYRITLTPDLQNQVKINKPPTYDRNRYLGIVQSYQEAFGKGYPLKSKWLESDINDFRFGNWKKLPKQKINWNHGNFPGHNHDYPEASWTERKKILEAHIHHELGLLYFLQNDESVPSKIREYTTQYGLAKDEFVDNGHIPYEIYVREARRIIGRHTLTEHDCTLAKNYERAPIKPDSIAIGEWPMDSHECNTTQQYGSAYEGAVLLSESTRPYQIPYRSILPETLDNLLVPVCLSATHIAWGSVRVEPTFMHVAESAGCAAVLSVQSGTPVANLKIEVLQRKLLKNGIMISFFNEFDMTTEQPWVRAIQFLGTKGFFSTYDANPDALLAKSVAMVWIKCLKKYLKGKLEPSRAAEKVYNALKNPKPAEGITRVAFKEALRGRHIDLENVGEDGDDYVKVHEAAQWIYGVMTNE